MFGHCGGIAGCVVEGSSGSCQAIRVNPTAQALRLDDSRLKRHLAATSGQAEPRDPVHAAPTFVELLGCAAGTITNCSVELESGHGGKLHLELKAIATTISGPAATGWPGGGSSIGGLGWRSIHDLSQPAS